MKKISFVLLGLLVASLVIGAVACSAGEQGPYEVTSGLHDGVVMTQPRPTITVAPTTTASPGKGGETYEPIVNYMGSTATTDRMVIRNAYLTLVVDNVSTSLQQINTLAGSYGGFVVNSNISEDKNKLYAYISFRVNSNHFNDTLQALRNLAVDVKSESTTGQDVTEQYTDLASRLRNLEASETQLLELMKKAGTVTEILAVQKELTNTRGQIEVLKGQMQYLEQSAALAFFNVTLEQSKLIVDFTAETRTVKEGGTIRFYADVSGGFSPYTYEWDFGDGDTSTDANPAHVYRSSGDFTVSLKITDDKGISETYVREGYISVQPGWSAGSVAESAWSGLLSFFRGMGAFFIGLGIFSPLWIIILVILYFAWWRRRKKKA
jgi:PKD repeat protein